MYEDVQVVADQDFEAFFRLTFPRLASLGALRSGRIDIGRELAQETLLRAHDRWDEVSQYDSPSAWCRTVMVRLLIDHHRSSRSEQQAVDRLALRRPAESGMPNFSEWRRLLDGLNQRQQTIVTMYYADDLAIDEIAQRMNTSAGAVKAALFKARRTLRSKLDVEGRSDV